MLFVYGFISSYLNRLHRSLVHWITWVSSNRSIANSTPPPKKKKVWNFLHSAFSNLISCSGMHWFNCLAKLERIPSPNCLGTCILCSVNYFVFLRVSIMQERWLCKSSNCFSSRSTSSDRWQYWFSGRIFILEWSRKSDTDNPRGIDLEAYITSHQPVSFRQILIIMSSGIEGRRNSLLPIPHNRWWTPAVNPWCSEP